MTEFDSRKIDLRMEAALVDAASAFLKENAKIRPDDIEQTSEFWNLRIKKIRESYGVSIYVELEALDSRSACCHPTPISAGDPPPDNAQILSKSFPIALRETLSDLEIYPALVKVSVYVG
jgi:hypothetical protein